ncbi:MAG: hypothetical protein LKJ71_09165, partial [Acetobacter peroxydans]|nr:hypothetical protein [Acetobacter peroxydans]
SGSSHPSKSQNIINKRKTLPQKSTDKSQKIRNICLKRISKDIPTNSDFPKKTISHIQPKAKALSQKNTPSAYPSLLLFSCQRPTGPKKLADFTPSANPSSVP